MNNQDQKLVKLIAQMWVASGGDADGFEWSQRKIQEHIEVLEELEKLQKPFEERKERKGKGG